METVIRQFEIPVKAEYDVAVVGGGPAGFCAAVAAARNGASTILIEKNGCCGGMATTGLVGPFMTSYDKDGKQMIIRGMFEEVVDRLVAAGGAIHPRDVSAGTAFTSYIVVGHDHVTPFEPEILKRVIDDMLLEAGVHLLYHTDFVEPMLDKDRIEGLIVHSKNGLEAVKAAVVIDCTGDADVAFRSGVSCELGDETAGRIQPATMFFRIGNVDSDKVEADIRANKDNFFRKNGVNYRSFHWRVAQAKANGDWHLDRVSIGLFRGVRKDEWSVNTSRIMGVNGADAQSLTDAEVIGRKQVQEIFAFLKKYVPGCEDAVLLTTASQIGIRETRHIRGEATLTTDDVLQGNVPDDAVLLASNSIDVHGRFGPMSNEYVTVQNGEWYGVSYRSLVPIGVSQLLVAGRCVSATSEAAGAIRVMPPCMELGHAAGTAAAMAVKAGVSVREIDTNALRDRLIIEGTFLGQDTPAGSEKPQKVDLTEKTA